jgi:hypothetical protein
MQAGREGGARREVGAQGGWRAGRLGARTKRNPSRRGVCVVVGGWDAGTKRNPSRGGVCVVVGG